MTLGENSMTVELWSDQHPVLQVLRARRASKSEPGNRDDKYKVGLAVEGGGLRGVVSAAMLCALEDLGYADSFDHIYACSSGAVNAAYFINRQTWFPLTIYFDDLTTGEFLDFRRILFRKAPMDLDYVFNDVLVKRKPLDYEKIIEGQQRLHVMITDVPGLKPLDVSKFMSANDLRSAIVASAWLPLATKGTATFRGSSAIDGGVLRPHPFRAAIADDCSHILSLSTRPIGPPRTKISFTNRLAARNLERMRSGLGRAYIDAVREYLNKDKPYLAHNRLHPDKDPSVLDLAPTPGTPEVKRHELDRSVLLDGARSAYHTTYLALERKNVIVVPRLAIYEPERELEPRTATTETT
ncbi:MAG: patatin-like phospholipase family protein [Pseudonocardiaceae bacterium]